MTTFDLILSGKSFAIRLSNEAGMDIPDLRDTVQALNDGTFDHEILRGLPEDQKKRYKPGGLTGAHWCFADLSFCLERRARKAKRHGVRFADYDKITEQSVIDECKLHENDPVVF